MYVKSREILYRDHFAPNFDTYIPLVAISNIFFVRVIILSQTNIDFLVENKKMPSELQLPSKPTKLAHIYISCTSDAKQSRFYVCGHVSVQT